MPGFLTTLTDKAARGSLGRVLARAARHKRRIALAAAASAVFSLLSFGTIAAFIPFLDTLLENEGSRAGLESFAAKLGPYRQAFLDFVYAYILPDKTRALYIFTGLLLVVTILKGMAKFVVDYCVGQVTNATIVDLQNDLYDKVLRREYAFYQKTGVAQILSRFTNDIESIYKGVKTLSGKVITEPMRELSLLVFCLLVSWKLTLLSLLVLPFIGFGVVWVEAYARKKGRKMLAAKANVLAMMQEVFQGIRIVKVFGAEKQEKERFHRENDVVMDQNMKVVVAEGLVAPAMEALGILGIAAVVIVGCQSVFDGEMTRGTFVSFYMAIIFMIDPIRKLANVNARMQACVAGADRVFEFLDAPTAIENGPGAAELAPLQRAVEFERVGFSYDGTKVVLADVSITVRKGESLAIVGLSGAGKTTFVNLIPRFFDPSEGRVLIDGVDVRAVTLESLRRQIGVVTQETLLFHDTVANNISYGAERQDAARVEASARAASAEEFIRQLPKGYQTVIGEQGVILSGGQRQRLAIARAIYKNPSILILDEATSSLDSQNEAMIQKVLNDFMKERTTFVIAHRLSTVEKADRILVLSEGRVEAVGTHAELMETQGTYRRFCQQQFKLQAS